MRFYKLFKKGEIYFMKKKKIAATAVALAMAAVTVFSVGNTSSVKAADVADKSAIDLEINGSYEEKKISTADSDVINKAFGYEDGINNVIVCGENATGYIDYEKSSIPFKKIYATYVFSPIFSRDENGNLVIAKDENGEVEKKDGYWGYVSWDGNHNFPTALNQTSFNVLSKETVDQKYLNCFMNENLGNPPLENVVATDAYIIRIKYTTDDGPNYSAIFQDEYYGMYTEEDAKNRSFGYTDFWIIPEGVSTVLNYANGIQKDGDAWYYYKDGVVDTSYIGLAKYNGSWWYVKNGKIDFSATTLCKYNGSWWYVKNGKVDFGSTTLCKYNGSWWYVSGGKVNFGATGLCKYNGTWWYVKNGKVDFGSTTLCKYNGSWWYVSGGKVNFGATGLCKYNGTWWYVKNGKVSFTTTLCKYNGIWWYINNGAVNFNKTTLVKYGSNWYAVAKGQVAWKYTGKLAYNGRYFNVVNGVVKF